MSDETVHKFDVRRARADFVYFAEHVAGIKMSPVQVALFEQVASMTDEEREAAIRRFSLRPRRPDWESMRRIHDALGTDVLGELAEAAEDPYWRERSKHREDL